MLCQDKAASSRLIPAHAGKTGARGPAAGGGEAHPRSRGENAAVVASRAGEGGSSPLTRGKQRWRSQVHEHRRLIPAHAGKTVRLEVRLLSVEAHPRSRGENAVTGVLSEFVAGSSPLTRGKPGKDLQRYLGLGLIPAHAGKTSRGHGRPPRHRAHPRSRGENAHGHGRRHRRGGSSPLTRGKPRSPALPPASRGLIPAHAGKT